MLAQGSEPLFLPSMRQSSDVFLMHVMLLHFFLIKNISIQCIVKIAAQRGVDPFLSLLGCDGLCYGMWC